MRKTLYLLILCSAFLGCKPQEAATEVTSETSSAYQEKYRPQLHFSPKEKWMNDPNGMVYHKGEYHLFYQHYPQGTTWGPMHWGHAVSKDLVHWEHLPIALYPDSLGYIFSGSAVVDKSNTSGLGTPDNPPLVAIYTYHSPEREKAGRTDYQYQGIAYSTDDGRTWTKYENNPVLKNQGIKDFRDPKVFWHEETKKWVMILAVKDHVELWNSADLKAWNKLSDFGNDYGAHGGVWECPDLFPLTVEGESTTKWVMLVSINPGGPNGGSATQYFVGDFDGVRFKSDTDKTTTNWIDYGPDNYAGVTWFNAPDNRKIFLGWMSNWAYAEVVPTSTWRSATTTPRDLKLAKTDQGIRVRSVLSREFMNAQGESENVGNKTVQDSSGLNPTKMTDLSKSILSGEVDAKTFRIVYANRSGQKLIVGYDASSGRFYIDRSKAGANDFSENFNGVAYAPRLSRSNKIPFTIVADNSSIEVFFDDGLSVMTAVFFPDEPLTEVTMVADEPIQVSNIQLKALKSVW